MNDPAPRRILLAITGGIAAYKSPALVSQWVQSGHDVRTVASDAALKFVTQPTLSSLSGHRVATSMWDQSEWPESPHVGLARWADIMVVAPASANALARLALGLCDDLVTLTATALPAATPLLLAPAMNADMWAKPTVQRNLQTLRDLWPNLHEVGPEQGWQACRTSGPGRMADPNAIVTAVDQCLKRHRDDPR